MTQISADDPYFVMINTFDVAPDRAETLMALLVEATEATMRHQPGFVSANLHMSHDRTRIANYAQWQSRADFERMLGNPEARVHMEEAQEIADRFSPVFYEVAHVEDRVAV